MLMNLVNLDPDIRTLMLQEVEYDVNCNKLYISDRLNVIGRQIYLIILKDAIQNYDDSWLANQINFKGLLNSTESRNLKNKTIQVKMRSDAHEVLAEDEFNRFYMRGLCLYAISKKIASLKVYRAKETHHPRPESWRLIGTLIDPIELLEDLRQNVGQPTRLGIGEAGSGLSVMIL
ncbi:MAG: hypothetical protein ABR936_10310 [Bacteroidota bacterium]|jgi:hypothetical protein